MRIYVANKGEHDYSSLNRFLNKREDPEAGVVFLTKGPIDVHNLRAYQKKVALFLKDSKPTDFILHGGPPSLQSIITAGFAQKHDKLNLLIYRGESKPYKIITIDYSKVHDLEWEESLV
jgi:hypothetical protein